jgi:hypothetical protein
MTSNYVDSEALAKKTGGTSSPGAVASTCPKWTLSVTVKSKVDYWPKGDVRVWLVLRQGTLQFSDKYTGMASAVSPVVTFEGRGPQQYVVRAGTGDQSWTLGEADVTVNADASVQVVIEPQKWVVFQVVDQATGKRVDGAKLSVAIGAAAKSGQLTSSASGDTRNDEMFFLAKNETSKATELTHADVWEVVSVTSK